jgi:adenosylmethionine-8-amino-7-oxononanoate aminotransferase
VTGPRRIGDTPQGGPVRYLDASSGPVVSNLGHGNRRVLQAMQAQAAAVTFAYPGLFESEANVALADLVCKLHSPWASRRASP